MNDTRRHGRPNPRLILLIVAAFVIARGVRRRREWMLAEGAVR